MSHHSLIRAWVVAGSPPLEDLGAVIGTGYIELLRIFQGEHEASEGTKQVLADAFGTTVKALFE